LIRLCFAISQRGTFRAKIKIIINLSQSVFQICKNYHFLNWPLILFLKNDWKGIGRRLSFWIIHGFRMLLLMKLMLLLLMLLSMLSLLMLLLLMVLFLMMILFSLYLMLMLNRKLQIETIKPRLFFESFLTSFKSSSILWGCWQVDVGRFEPTTKLS